MARSDSCSPIRRCSSRDVAADFVAPVPPDPGRVAVHPVATSSGGRDSSTPADQSAAGPARWIRGTRRKFRRSPSPFVPAPNPLRAAARPDQLSVATMRLQLPADACAPLIDCAEKLLPAWPLAPQLWRIDLFDYASCCKVAAFPSLENSMLVAGIHALYSHLLNSSTTTALRFSSTADSYGW